MTFPFTPYFSDALGICLLPHHHMGHVFQGQPLQFIFPNLPIFYPITYMAEFLYAGSTITEELINTKSNRTIRGVTPDQTSSFFTR